MSKRGLPRRFKHSSNRTNLHQSASVHYTKRPNVVKRANFLNSDVLEINEELDFRMLVCLPDGEDINEWLAYHTKLFLDQTSQLFGLITEFCDEASCPIMNAGPATEYLWMVSSTQKAVPISAPQYCSRLFNWTKEQTDDETLFPSKIGEQFPEHFFEIVQKIFKRLFRIYAHVYHEHFHHVEALECFRHVNTSFKHFLYFCKEFDLMSQMDYKPLAPLISKMYLLKE